MKGTTLLLVGLVSLTCLTLRGTEWAYDGPTQGLTPEAFSTFLSQPDIKDGDTILISTKAGKESVYTYQLDWSGVEVTKSLTFRANPVASVRGDLLVTASAVRFDGILVQKAGQDTRNKTLISLNGRPEGVISATFADCTFNSANYPSFSDKGNIINAEYADVLVTNVVFNGCTSNQHGGCGYFKDCRLSVLDTVITNCQTRANKVNGAGFALEQTVCGITNCQFLCNGNGYPNSPYNYGEALSVIGGDSVEKCRLDVSNCRFEGNYGVGACIGTASVMTGVVHCADCTFVGNTSLTSSLGPVFCSYKGDVSDDLSVSFERCYMASNRTASGSAVIYSACRLSMADCVIEDNDGGRMTETYGGILTICSPASFARCVFRRNRIVDDYGLGGGGVFRVPGNANRGELLSCDSCLFVSNAISGAKGGAVFSGRGGTGTFVNSTFIGNSAEHGGSVFGCSGSFNNYTSVKVRFCTFADNVSGDGVGCVHLSQSTDSELVGCAFARNVVSEDVLEVSLTNNGKLALVSGCYLNVLSSQAATLSDNILPADVPWSSSGIARELADNKGQSLFNGEILQTLALNDRSPLRNGAPYLADVAVDARNVMRIPKNGRVDIGAYQFVPPSGLILLIR